MKNILPESFSQNFSEEYLEYPSKSCVSRNILKNYFIAL